MTILLEIVKDMGGYIERMRKEEVDRKGSGKMGKKDLSP